MPDIKAIDLISKQIKKFKSLPNPPRSFGGVESYKKKVDKTLQEVNKEMSDVRTYVDDINCKLQELKAEIENTIEKNKEAIKEIFGSLRETVFGNETEIHSAVCDNSMAIEQLQLALELEKVSKKIIDDALHDLIAETEMVCAKVNHGITLTEDDIAKLLEGLDNWKHDETEAMVQEELILEEKRQKDEELKAQREAEERKEREREEERKRKEELEKLRKEKEETERRRKEEEERRRNEEEIQRRIEEEKRRLIEEERLRLIEEEERRLIEEEEQRLIEEEERRLIEEERRLIEEEELRLIEEELKRCEEEEEKRRTEENKRRLEEKMRKKERQRKAAEEQKRREEEEKEEKKRLALEQLRREREERLEANRQKKDAKEKRRREEERERRRQAEEERRREEEERRLAEEERKREEEQRLIAEEERRREKEERRLAEEERRRKEEEGRHDEEDSRREEERRLAEEQKKRRERRSLQTKKWKQEGEDLADRDPSSWIPIVYNREDAGEVDGRRIYHCGVKCILTCPPGDITKDDLECYASDEVDSVIEILEDEETPISSLIELKTKSGCLHSKFPSRLYIPRYIELKEDEEILMKASVDGRDWITSSPVPCTSNLSEQETVLNLAGVEINDFTSVQVMVVCRPRWQTVVTDEQSVTIISTMDKKFSLFLPRDTFQGKTELRLTVRPITEDLLASFVQECASLENILSVYTYATLDCQQTTKKNIDFDLTKKKKAKKDKRSGKGYHVYSCGNKVWELANIEFKRNRDVVSVNLPSGKHKYVVMEVKVNADYPEDKVPLLVKKLHECINTTLVRMIVRQKDEEHDKCVVRVVREDQCRGAISFLNDCGFTVGPDVSAPFIIQEGQHIQISFSGNIEAIQEMPSFGFLSYFGGVKADLTLKVKDMFKQKDLPAYVGNAVCFVFDDQENIQRRVEVAVSIPKNI